MRTTENFDERLTDLFNNSWNIVSYIKLLSKYILITLYWKNTPNSIANRLPELYDY